MPLYETNEINNKLAARVCHYDSKMSQNQKHNQAKPRNIVSAPMSKKKPTKTKDEGELAVTYISLQRSHPPAKNPKLQLGTGIHVGDGAGPSGIEHCCPGGHRVTGALYS